MKRIIAALVIALVLGGAGLASAFREVRKCASVPLRHRGRVVSSDLQSRMRATVGSLAEPFFLVPERGRIFVYRHPEITEDEILRGYTLKRLLYPRPVQLTSWDQDFVERGLEYLTPDFFVVNLRPETEIPASEHFGVVYRGEGIVLRRFGVSSDGRGPR